MTAQNKMRHASEHQVSFAGDGKIQTVFFQDREINRANGRRIEAFLQAQGPLPSEGFKVDRPGGTISSSQGRLWSGVPGMAVADLIGALRFPDDTFEPQRIRDYIRAQLTIGELADWTVIMPSGEGSQQGFAGSVVNTVSRRLPKFNDIDGELSYGTILSPRDEALDLSVGEFEEALQNTNRARAEKGKPVTDVPAGPDIRAARGRRPQRALLLIYPLDPAPARLADLGMPLYGLVVSFPESTNARSVTYKYNSVERRLDLQ